MNREQYYQQVNERFPSIIKAYNHINPELIKDVALSLFIEEEIKSDLYFETINQLKSIRNNGILEF
jgi:hypothetical protein